MSIGAIGAQSTTQTQSPQSNWQNVLGAASSALGLSTSALQQQLQSGQSLASIAQTQGVSTSSLVSTVAGALSQSGQLSGASAGQLQQIATNRVNRTPGGHHHHHPAGGAAGASGTAALLAALSPSDDGDASATGATGSSSDSGASSQDPSQSGSTFDTFA